MENEAVEVERLFPAARPKIEGGLRHTISYLPANRRCVLSRSSFFCPAGRAVLAVLTRSTPGTMKTPS